MACITGLPGLHVAPPASCWVERNGTAFGSSLSLNAQSGARVMLCSTNISDID